SVIPDLFRLLITCWIIGVPHTSWSTLNFSDFILVPLPAARIIALVCIFYLQFMTTLIIFYWPGTFKTKRIYVRKGIPAPCQYKTRKAPVCFTGIKRLFGFVVFKFALLGGIAVLVFLTVHLILRRVDR